MDEHPVFEKIDRDRPYFDRLIYRHRNGQNSECRLRVWLPVQLENGGWVAAVDITELGLPAISAMPGEDPLDALIRALAFARDVMEKAEGSFLFGARERELGGLIGVEIV